MIRYLLIVFLFLSPLISISQSITPVVVSSGGGFFKDNSNSISFTVSELITATQQNGNHILTQGFQQPTPYIISSVEMENNFLSDVKVYPNPFGSFLNLSISTPEDNNYQVYIYDMHGRLIKPPLLLTQGFGNQIYELDVEGLSSGIYIIRVLEQDGKKHTELKIIRM